MKIHEQYLYDVMMKHGTLIEKPTARMHEMFEQLLMSDEIPLGWREKVSPIYLSLLFDYVPRGRGPLGAQMLGVRVHCNIDRGIEQVMYTEPMSCLNCQVENIEKRDDWYTLVPVRGFRFPMSKRVNYFFEGKRQYFTFFGAFLCLECMDIASLWFPRSVLAVARERAEKDVMKWFEGRTKTYEEQVREGMRKEREKVDIEVAKIYAKKIEIDHEGNWVIQR